MILSVGSLDGALTGGSTAWGGLGFLGLSAVSCLVAYLSSGGSGEEEPVLLVCFSS